MTQPMAVSSPAEGQIPQTCRHHWVIEPAAGPVSPGICQTCGGVREFRNFVPDPRWGDFELFSSYKPGSLERYRAASVERTAGLVDCYRVNDDEE